MRVFTILFCRNVFRKSIRVFALFLTLTAVWLTHKTAVSRQVPLGYVSAVAYSPDGNKLAVGRGTEWCVPDSPSLYLIQIIDSVTQVILQTLEGSECSVTSLDWSPDGTKLAASSLDAYGIRVWDIQSGLLIMRVQEGGQGFASVRWKPDGSVLASAAISNGIDILDPSMGIALSIAPIGGTSLDWSPDGSHLASGNTYSTTIAIADMVANQQAMELHGHTGPVSSIDWSPDGTKLATGGGFEDSTVRIWNAATGANLLVLQGQSQGIGAVKWSRDSQLLASAADDGTVRVWNGSTGEQLGIVQTTGRVYSVDWSPNGRTLAFGGSANIPQIIAAPGSTKPLLKGNPRTRDGWDGQECSVES